jgi:hypothetical protein
MGRGLQRACRYHNDIPAIQWIRAPTNAQMRTWDRPMLPRRQCIAAIVAVRRKTKLTLSLSFEPHNSPLSYEEAALASGAASVRDKPWCTTRARGGGRGGLIETKPTEGSSRRYSGWSRGNPQRTFPNQRSEGLSQPTDVNVPPATARAPASAAE